MQTSSRGRELIKKYEGIRLKAYKPVAAEKYWTIGYGHYGADVTEGMEITKERAEELLIADLKKFEKAVNKYMSTYNFNQNQYDALVSFAFNCGAGNLDKLVNYGKRTISEIANKIPAYNKGSGRVLKGLVVRRAEEQELFLTPVVNEVKHEEFPLGTYEIVASALNVRDGAGKKYRRKTKRELTADGKVHSNGNGALLKNTKITVSIVVHTDNNSVWGKIPSGWICLSENGKQYVKKV